MILGKCKFLFLFSHIHYLFENLIYLLTCDDDDDDDISGKY